MDSWYGLPPALRPRSIARARPFSAAYLRIVLGLTGRAMALAYRLDATVRAELEGLPEGFTFALRARSRGPSAAWRREANGGFSCIGAGPAKPDVLMGFTSVRDALSVLTFSKSAYECYAKGGLAVSGDLGATMAFIRALGIVETLLLPGFLARRVLKRPARMPFYEKAAKRLALYLGVAFVGAKA